MPSGDAHRSLARALDILELCSLNGSGYTLTQLSTKPAPCGRSTA